MKPWMWIVLALEVIAAVCALALCKAAARADRAIERFSQPPHDYEK